MDAQLAAIYGTGAQADDDIEKTAAAELLMKLAAENNVDLSQFNEYEIADMLNDIQKTAAEEETKDEEHSREESESGEPHHAEAEEKLAEADYLGRVMAHAMVQEVREIEKSAANSPAPTDIEKHPVSGAGRFLSEEEGKGAVTKNPASAGGRFGREVVRRGKNVGRGLLSAFKAEQFREGSKKQKGLESLIKRKASDKAGQDALEAGLGGRLRHGIDLAKKMKYRGLAKSVGAYGGAAALLGGAAYGAKRALGKDKHSSVDFDQLIAQRAYEMAKEAGWVDSDGDLLEPGVKEASAYDIDTAALSLLEDSGYPVQWNE